MEGNINNYYEVAEKARIEENNLIKAIYYYKVSLNNSQNIIESIKNLVNIYIKTEMYDEAIELLDANIKKIDDDIFCDLKISVFSSSRDIKYVDKIINTYDKVIELEKSDEKKLDLMFSEALLLTRIGDYNRAINIYDNWFFNTFDVICLPTSKLEMQKINYAISMCYIYSIKNDKSKEKKFADLILSYDHNNLFARLIINGKINIKNVDIDDIYEDYGVSDDVLRFINNFDYSAEIERLKDYFDSLGRFIGTERDAHYVFACKNLVEDILFYDKREPNRAFINAKISAQQHSNGQFYEFIGLGFYYLALNNYNKLLKENCKKIYDDLWNHILDCLDTTIDILINEEDFKLEEEEVKANAGGYFISINNYDDDHDEFYYKLDNGMKKNMFVSLSYLHEIEIIRYFYIKSITILSRLDTNISHNSYCESAFVHCPDIFERGVNEKGFLKNFNKISIEDTKLYKSDDEIIKDYYKRKTLVRSLYNFTNDYFSEDINTRRNMIDLLRCLVMTDNPRYSNYYTFLNTLLDFSRKKAVYANLNHFEALSEKINNIINDIENGPTSFEFEILLPVIKHFYANVYKKISEIYEKSIPDLCVKLNDEITVDRETMEIVLPFSFTNSSNHQDANNVQIILSGDGIVKKIQNEDIFKADNRPYNEKYRVKVSNEIMTEGTCILDLCIKFKCFFSKNDLRETQINKTFNISFNFEKIKNEFSTIKSKVSDEKMFFGREKTMQDIIDKVVGSYAGKCIILYGQMRAGKTTILKFLIDRLRKDKYNIIINYGALIETSNDNNDKLIFGFFNRLFLLFRYEIQYKHQELYDYLKENSIDLEDIDDRLNKEKNIDRFIDLFKAEFDIICNAIEKSNKNYKIFLICDEFTALYEWIRKDRISDKIEGEKINDRILKILKGLVENYNLIEIFAGHNMLEFAEEFNTLGNAEFFKISYLEKDDAMKMMEEPIKYHGKSRYKEDTLERLYQLTSGSAYLIVILCIGLVDYMNKNEYTYVTNEVLKDYLEAFFKGETNTGHSENTLFEPQYAEFNYIGDEKEKREDLNKELIERIARNSKDNEGASLDDIVKSETDKDILNTLEKRDVIYQFDNMCKLRVGFYREWIVNKTYRKEDKGERK